MYPRVAAIDDVEDHLLKIVRGLGRAGFSVLPFLFEDGRLEEEPPRPLEGVRIVFTDIHLIGGGGNDKTHAANIVRCLKKIVAPGPYILVFWSAYPGDGDRIAALIDNDGPGAGLIPPIGYASIDKRVVFAAPGGGAAHNSQQLRDLILAELARFGTLSQLLAWEERVARAAAHTSDGLYALTTDSTERVKTWEGLLAYLACEAVGVGQARENIDSALDVALLPLLEDRLGQLPSIDPMSKGPFPVHELVQKSQPKRPDQISVSRLNAGYLVDESNIGPGSVEWERGMVTKLGGAFVNSGEFIRAFGVERDELIKREFVVDPAALGADGLNALELHVLSLDAECDHVQGKVSTRRYLLALLFPESLLKSCVQVSKNGSYKCKNDSVVDVGSFCLRGLEATEVRLLVSCKSFLVLAPSVRINGTCRFRIRRAVLSEIMHRYARHAERPGVMRFRKD